VAVAIRSSSWLYPAVETVHLLGVALLVGGAVVFDLRLLGAFARLPVAGLARAALPVARLGFAAVVPTGLLLFATEATALAGNGAMRLKALLIVAALLNIVVFHRGVGRTMDAWPDAVQVPGAARIAGAVSVAAWVGALVAGQWIAYR
jgi:hypothetical protein